MKVALLCSGLGHIHRGHEVFARQLFDRLQGHVDLTLFKGGGEPGPSEKVIPNLPRNSPLLRDIHVTASPRWAAAVREQERHRVEARTFAHAALPELLAGGYDLLHCLEDDVCNVLHAHRHLFARVPKVLFSNGGAIPARDLPDCDAVQEHTAHNLRYSARGKAFMVPHGVDLRQFRPGLPSDVRARLGIAADALVVISVGSLSHTHKRMDYTIREVAQVPGAHLLAVGQATHDTESIVALGRELLGARFTATTVSHEELPQWYAAADAFVLGSEFETFGIVYIEAMATGLPVVCTRHVNQRAIVQEGWFVDVTRPGAVAAVLRDTPRGRLREMGARGRAVAERCYDWDVLVRRYGEEYARILAQPSTLPRWTRGRQFRSHLRNAWLRLDDSLRGRAE